MKKKMNKVDARGVGEENRKRKGRGGEKSLVTRIIAMVATGLGVIGMLLLVIKVISMGMVPTGWLILGVVGILILAMGLSLMAFWPKGRTWMRMMAGVIALVLGVGSVFAFVKLNGATEFVAESFGTVEAKNPVEEVARDAFIMYISGIDERSGSLPEKSRSDLNILAVVNPKRRAVMLVNVPRDYYVEMAGMGRMDKLTHAGDIGGLALSTATIEKLLDVKINYATRVNFNLLERLVDAVGGVTVRSDIGKSFALYWQKDCVINDGENNLDGRCAVAYARERLAFGDGDLERGRNQEAVIAAVFEKVAREKSLLLNYEAILDSLRGNFETSFTGEEVGEMVRYIAAGGGDWNFRENNLGVAGSGEEYGVIFPGERKFVFYVDWQSVQKVHDDITEFMK